MRNSNTAAVLQQLALLPLRLIIGWGFIAHGAAKLSRGTAGFEKLLLQTGVPFAHINAQVVPWLELIGGIALFVGVFVRIISFPLMITMIVAMLTIHIHYGFSSVNTIGLTPDGLVFGPPGYEINLLYIAGLLALTITGAGKISVDYLLRSGKRLAVHKNPFSAALPTLIVTTFTIFSNQAVFSRQAATTGSHYQNDTAIIVSGVPLQPQDISPLLIGERLPSSYLHDDDGNMINLYDAVHEKPTILIFYRGGWCPYCTKQLARVQEIKSELDQLGYQIIAISTDSPENLKQTHHKEKLSFTLLSDADLSLAKSFGIAYKAPAVYDKFLPQTSGGKNKHKLLPVPSVFILDQTGTIQFEYINPDFKQRMSSALLLEISAALARQAR
jgi:peroxiredoxin/uncharacterized membrane protein YphA (DoxX/SURF4 family)